MAKFEYHEEEENEKFHDPTGCYQFMTVVLALVVVIGLLWYTGAIMKIINLFK